MGAFALIVIRRLIAFLPDFGVLTDSQSMLHDIDSALLIVISILNIWGFWSMKNNFEKFDVVEKQAREKMAQFAEDGERKRKPELRFGNSVTPRF